MNEEGFEHSNFEEWDEDFVNILLVQEQLVLTSSSSSSFIPNPIPIPDPLPTATFSQFQHHRLTDTPHSPPRELSQRPLDVDTIDRLPNPLPTATFSQFQHHRLTDTPHSPPRELSQRPLDVDTIDRLPNHHGVSTSVPPLTRPLDDVKDSEILRLKRELEHASKQLSNLERECFELRNERNKKEEQLKCLSLIPAKKDLNGHSLNNTNLRLSPASKNHGFHQQSRNTSSLGNEIAAQNFLGQVSSSSKAIGIQTDKTDDSSNLGLNDNFPSHANVSNKLLGIWSSASDQKLGRDLISKLFTACPEDFHFLLGCFRSGDSVKGEGSSNTAIQCQRHSFHPSEAAKISHLYSVLTEIGNGLLRLESLIEPLVELCYLENVDILCHSLAVLHVFLKHLFSSGRKFEERDSVKIEGATSHMSEDRILFRVTEEASVASYQFFGTKSSLDPQNFSNSGIWKVDTGLPSCVDWVSLYNFLDSVAMRKTDGHARLEAVSAMNLILLRTNALEEREMFGQASVFKSIARFLGKEAGSDVQKEALQLFFLLLNCPKLLTVFCSGCKDGSNAENNASTSESYGAILEGLADCIGSHETNLQDIELRKRAVVIVAFLASSGKSGFEILVNHKVCKGKSFVMLILQLLMWEMDVEVSTSSEPAESIKARALLMREALILLNRIVSNQWYSGIVLRMLTESREMAYMTIDIVSRLSREDLVRRQPTDSNAMQMRESEIADLAKQLKKRIFTYLGDK